MGLKHLSLVRPPSDHSLPLEGDTPPDDDGAGGGGYRRGKLDTYAWHEARLGDAAARAAIIESYQPYVVRLVSRMGIPQTAVQERDDLVSAGLVGLIDAVDRFDHERGVPFEAFARARIRGEIIDELRRLDGRGRLFWRRVREGEAMSEASADALSLDRLVEDGIEPSVDDASEPILEQALVEDVVDAIAALPERERLVIRRYYGGERTLREIGTELGVSEARVCQLHARAIARLRNELVTRLEPALVAGAA